MKATAKDLVPSKIINIPQDEKTREYWIGTKKSCPKKDVVLAGISFNSRTGDINGRGGERGAVVKLTQLQVDAILERLKIRIVRKDANGRGQVIGTNINTYVPESGDDALANHVYMVPADIAARVCGESQFRKSLAPSLIDMLERGTNETDWMLPEMVSIDALKAEEDQAIIDEQRSQIEALKAQIEGGDGDDEKDQLITELDEQDKVINSLKADLAEATKEPSEDIEAEPTPEVPVSETEPETESETPEGLAAKVKKDRTTELSVFTNAELMEFCAANKVEYTKTDNKATLVAAIVNAGV